MRPVVETFQQHIFGHFLDALTSKYACAKYIQVTKSESAHMHAVTRHTHTANS